MIIIAILDFSLTPLPEYMTKTVRVADKHRDYELNNFVNYYYIELEKFRNQNPDMNEKLNQWLAFIDGERGDLLDMAKKENKIIEEANQEYNVLTGDAEIKRLAEIRMLSEMEEHSALTAARAEGMAEGRINGILEGKKETAKKLLELGMSLDLIEKATGLSTEEILEVSNQLKKH